jgi:tRNA (Thr-GGU) A37 N-methylase
VSSSIVLTPIGVVHSAVDQPLDCAGSGIKARIELDASRFKPASLAGLGDFSQVEVVFAFHRVAESDIRYAARHPRARTDWPAGGIFAQRGKDGPNCIAATVCRLMSAQGLGLDVEGLNASEGTPVLDNKPCRSEFGPREETRQPAGATE